MTKNKLPSSILYEKAECWKTVTPVHIKDEERLFYILDHASGEDIAKILSTLIQYLDDKSKKEKD